MPHWQRAFVILFRFLWGIFFLSGEPLAAVSHWLILVASSVIAMSMVPRHSALVSADHDEEQASTVSAFDIG